MTVEQGKDVAPGKEATPGEDVAPGGEGGAGAAVPARRSESAGELRSLAIAAVIGVLLLIWSSGSGFNQDLVILAATYSLISLGLYVPFVMVGSMSLAYAAYAAIGAYGVAIIADETTWPLWIAWIAGPIVAMVVAVILGFATRRLSHWYLAAVTLLFATAFQVWLGDASDITGGAAGIGGLRPFELLGWTLTRDQSIVAAILLVMVVAFALDRLRISPWGVVARSTREVPLAVNSSGVRTTGLNLVALGLGAAIASWGGALFTSSVGSTTPGTFTLHIVFLAIFMPLIGGVGTPWGAVLGGLIVVELTLNFPLFETSGTLLLAIGVLVVLLLAPNGLLTFLDDIRKRVWSWVSDRRAET